MPPKKIPQQYLPKTLSKEDRAKQKKSIEEGTVRPKVESFKSKRSKHVVAFEKKYGKKITNDSFIDKNIITRTGIKKILDKGRGAYFSSGSRPNQTMESWARARLASVLTFGSAFKVDKDIAEKYGREKWLKSRK